MRILIVDDEKIVLDSVSHILLQNFDHIEIETARNGREGMAKLEHHRPHLVMTDMRMPGMSGLEFIKQARRFDDQVKIIIATAFDQFDYAKEAFNYQVEDYVLKPLTKQKLIDVVTKVMRKMAEEKNRRTQELESIDRLYHSLQMVENNFFHMVMQHLSLDEQLPVFRDLLSLELEKGYLVAFEAVALPRDATWQQTSDYNNRLSDACEDFKGQLKLNFSGMVSQVLQNRFFAYVDAPLESSEGTEGAYQEDALSEDQLASFLEVSFQRCLKQYNAKLRIVYSALTPVSALESAYDQTLYALAISQKNVAPAFGSSSNTYGLEGFQVLLDDLFERVMLLDERWQSAFDQVTVYYHGLLMHSQQPQMAMDYLLLFFMRLGLEWESRLSLTGQFVRQGFLGTFRHQDDTGRLEMVQKMIEAIENASVKASAKKLTEPVTFAVKEIQNRFAEEITLEEVARGAHVTSQYLSKIFKDEMGTTFKTYLTDLRLAQSKALLQAGQLSVKDVAYAIGYNDPNYFVRLFKKTTGFTPGEYQKVML